MTGPRPAPGFSRRARPAPVLARRPTTPASVTAVSCTSPSGPDTSGFPSNEFVDLALQSGRLLGEISLAQMDAAENLLWKAQQALEAGDPQRAERLIERAARMPYDPGEEGSPGVRAASMLVYEAINDAFEVAKRDDMAWLEVPLAVHPDLDPTGQAYVASVVHGYVLQEPYFTISATEKRRIRAAVGDAPLEPDLGDGPDSTIEQRRDIIRSLVLAARALEDGYAAADKELST